MKYTQPCLLVLMSLYFLSNYVPKLSWWLELRSLRNFYFLQRPINLGKQLQQYSLYPSEGGHTSIFRGC
ncbi:hypothetical protein XELAEV_18038720mg [Xenopus laevis]|uniref:Uncharacterized protein n=1 Tax=Xenopus laevis TaxID=8355 RepID=A0A974C661_XENLA|nr:hypothetical protein XELAEV_18038720mg [Xenopus laevis]